MATLHSSHACYTARVDKEHELLCNCGSMNSKWIQDVFSRHYLGKRIECRWQMDPDEATIWRSCQGDGSATGDWGGCAWDLNVFFLLLFCFFYCLCQGNEHACIQLIWTNTKKQLPLGYSSVCWLLAIIFIALQESIVVRHLTPFPTIFDFLINRHQPDNHMHIGLPNHR